MKDLINTLWVQCFIVFFLGFTAISLTTEANGSYGIIEGGKTLIYIVGVISSIVYAWLMARYDSRIIITNHFTRGAYRTLLCSIFPVILFAQGANLNVLLLIISNLTAFYLFFDGFYSEYKDGNPYVLGKTSIEDKVLNWMNNKLGLIHFYPVWLVTVKLTLFLTSTLATIKYYLD